MRHFISDERLIRLAHQMICTMLASYDFPVLYREEYPYHDPDPLDDLRQFEDIDYSENLVMLSSLARVNDDNWGILKLPKRYQVLQSSIYYYFVRPSIHRWCHIAGIKPYVLHNLSN